jgi:PAS domain S-box-containing protein
MLLSLLAMKLHRRRADASRKPLARTRSTKKRAATIPRDLADQTGRYEQLFENANDGIFILSRDGHFVAVNDAYAEIVGLPKHELVGKTTEVLLPGKFEQSLARIERIIREGKLGPYELEIDTPTGKRAISLNGFALHEAGVPVGIMNIARDVTARRQAERALERESSFVRLLKDVAAAANQAGTATEALQMALEKVCGLTRWPVGHVYACDPETRALEPLRIWHLVEPERFEGFRRATETDPMAARGRVASRALAGVRPAWVSDLTLEERTPGTRAALAAGLKAGFAFPVLVGPEVVAVLEFYSDTEVEPDPLLIDVVGNIGTQLGRVIERDKAQADLAAARDQALESTQLKSSFLASMSHEIRTPLNGVIGMAGILLDTKLAPEQREYAETIRSCADALLGLINDILDFSKIEAGKLQIEPIPFDLEIAAQEVAELLAPKAAEKGLDLVLRYAPDTPNRLIGDPGRIRQILTNLVNNAIKFTEKGHVFIDVVCDRRDGATAWLRFAVEDSGIGIPPDTRGRIFERFTQADASTTRRYGGTGLGLAISKQLTELMGGSIGLESEPGRGSTFWFLLPLPLDLVQQQAPMVTPPSLADVRVLIVDDNGVNRRVLHELVTRWGMRNGGFASGAEALIALREARASGDPFRIAVVDMNMPEMDGEMFGRAVKADPELRDTVLVLLTSSGENGDARQMAQAGFAAYMTKPVRPSVLMDALATAWFERQIRGEALRVTRRAAPQPAPSDAGGNRASARVRVLVVEDNVVNQKVARLLLEQMGCRIELAANGKEAVEMIRHARYNVVFMDCQMPVMDGYEAAREIRRSEKPGTRVAIVATTAHAMQGDLEKCLAAGMDDYVGKPVRREVLEPALKKWAPQTPTPAPKAAVDPELGKTLEWMREEGGDEFVADLVTGFLQKARCQISDLDGALARGDLEKVKSITHDLRGSGATFGATKLAELVREIESRMSPDAFRAVTLDALRQEFERLEAVLADETAPRGAAASADNRSS